MSPRERRVQGLSNSSRRSQRWRRADRHRVAALAAHRHRVGLDHGQAYEHFVCAMLAALEAGPKVDGVYLALYGAMAVREVTRPEADIAARVRAVVGPDASIVATFDPHGNEDERSSSTPTWPWW